VPRQSIRSAHHFSSLQWLVKLKTTACQHSIEFVIQLAACVSNDFVVEGQGPIKPPVEPARLYQARVDLHIWSETILTLRSSTVWKALFSP